MRSTAGRARGGRAGRVLACTLLGAATTIVVAWGLALWLPHRGLERWQSVSMAVEGSGAAAMTITTDIDEYRRPGMVRRVLLERPAEPINSLIGRSDRIPIPPVNPLEVLEMRWSMGKEWLDRIWPPAGDINRSMPVPAKADPPIVQDARGWPWVALWCEMEEVNHSRRKPTTAADVRVRGGLFLWEGALRRPAGAGAGAGTGSLVQRSQFDLSDVRVLPCRPLWRGLAMNTAVYATAWWAAIAGVALLRSGRRRRRGHCPACGYNLAGIIAGVPCPECGTREA